MRRGVPATGAAGRVRRLVARATRRGDGGIAATVGPETLDPGAFLARARGVGNRLEVELDGGDVLRAAGAGAGRWPTALAVVSDLSRAAGARSATAAQGRPARVA